MNWSRTDPFVRIYTTIPAELRRLRADPRVHEIGLLTGRFLVARKDFDPLTGFVKRGRRLSPEERELVAARFAARREVDA